MRLPFASVNMMFSRAGVDAHIVAHHLQKAIEVVPSSRKILCGEEIADGNVLDDIQIKVGDILLKNAHLIVCLLKDDVCPPGGTDSAPYP